MIWAITIPGIFSAFLSGIIVIRIVGFKDQSITLSKYSDLFQYAVRKVFPESDEIETLN